jgi:hypothetical protein
MNTAVLVTIAIGDVLKVLFLDLKAMYKCMVSNCPL